MTTIQKKNQNDIVNISKNIYYRKENAIMKVKRAVIGILYAVAFASAIFACGTDNVSTNWWGIVKPLFITFIISITLATILHYSNEIRRITYPTLVCISAWAYQKKIILTKFARNANRLYKMNHCSFGRLFEYVQVLFDEVYNYEAVNG